MRGPSDGAGKSIGRIARGVAGETGPRSADSPGEGPQEHRIITGKTSGLNFDAQDVWLPDGVKIYPPVAATADVVSGSAMDTEFGDYARTVEVFGLDASFNEVSEIVALDGLTPVTTTTIWIRIFKLHLVDMGVNDLPFGSITCTIGPNLQAMIFAILAFPITVNSSLGTHYTIPAGKTGFITDWTISHGSNAVNQELYLQTRKFDASLNNPSWNTLAQLMGGNSENRKQFVAPPPLSEKTDIVVRGWALSNVSVGSIYELTLVDTPIPRITLPA